MAVSSAERASAHLLAGPRSLDESEALWRRLAEAGDVAAFQRIEWARAWLEHLGRGATPWIVAIEGPRPSLWAFALRRRAGVRVLGLLGDGVSDYLAPLGDASEDAARAVCECLLRQGGFDLFDLRSLFLPDGPRAALRTALRSASERVYERCPTIDTTGSWESYLEGRRKKFRANLKRAERRVEAHGRVAMAREKPDEALLQELYAVERDSWKWSNGTAYLCVPERRAFLESVLRTPQIPCEVWTCRVEGDLAGFAVVFTTRRIRHYYLPSFRQRYTDVGTVVLREIVRESFGSAFEEVDLLQGDEGYKLAWATREQAVYEVVAPSGGLLGPAAALALRSRWRLAQSSRARRLHGLWTSWRGRRQQGSESEPSP